jgi:hypothetical protein
MENESPPKAKPGKGRGKSKANLNADIRSRIGSQMRAMYDDVVKQGVPDRFADLIRKIDADPSKSEQ